MHITSTKTKLKKHFEKLQSNCYERKLLLKVFPFVIILHTWNISNLKHVFEIEKSSDVRKL